MINWDIYQANFRAKALGEGISEFTTSALLQYAKKLNDNGIPIIYDLEHLAKLVGYNKEYILRATENTTKFYRHFEISKKSGGKRKISEPLPSLKEIQRWILENILYKRNCSKYAKAYVPKHSIRSNAKFHKGQALVLTLDIKNFFPSLKEERVRQFFESIGYNNILSDYLSALCCLDGCLPQGAPTSPMLSNFIAMDIDQKIGDFVTPLNIRYTRYADDLTFSGNFTAGMIIKKVRKILSASDLRLNDSKIRAQKRNERQLVTGIVVNDKLQISKNKRLLLRQAVYYIKKFGLPSHIEKIQNIRANYLEHLMGTANYILFINPKDENVKAGLAYLTSLHEKATDKRDG